MNIVSFGGGTNSAALLIGLYKHKIPIDLITFADTGAEQQKTQQSGAAAQVAHPKPRLQPGKAAQQKGVGTGLEQAVIADEGESAGAEEFPVLQVDPPIG